MALGVGGAQYCCSGRGGTEKEVCPGRSSDQAGGRHWKRVPLFLLTGHFLHRTFGSQRKKDTQSEVLPSTRILEPPPPGLD